MEHSRKRQKNWERRQVIGKARTRGDDVARQWAVVAEERARLANSANYPVLNGLEESWRVLDAFYGGIIKRAGDDRVADTPLEALLFHVEMGFYPPPELLLALARAYDVYRYSNGKVSLEEAFFGPPRRKAGNHAKRRAAHAKLVHMDIEMYLLVKDGNTKIKAAELISERFGGKPEPESIIRMLNAFHAKRIK